MMITITKMHFKAVIKTFLGGKLLPEYYRLSKKRFKKDLVKYKSYSSICLGLNITKFSLPPKKYPDCSLKVPIKPFESFCAYVYINGF